MAGELIDALVGITIPDKAKALVIEADRLLANRHQEASYREHLESKIPELEAQKTELEAKIVALEAEVKRLRAEKGIGQAELQFDPATGTYTQAGSTLRYCAKCLLGNKRSPLQETRNGWRCACGASFHDPSRPYPTVSNRPGGSWMR